MQPFLLASAEEGVAVNGSPQSGGSNSAFGEARAKLTGSLQEESYCNGLIQSLHDAARTLEFAVKEKITPPRFSWFSATWLGADRYAWLKNLSYQVCAFLLHCHILPLILFPLEYKVFLVNVLSSVCSIYFTYLIYRLLCTPYYKRLMRFRREAITETRMLTSSFRGGTA